MISFEPWDDEIPQTPDRKTLLQSGVPMEEDIDYVCATCHVSIQGAPYLRIVREILAYEEYSDLQFSVEYQCWDCWRIYVGQCGVKPW